MKQFETTDEWKNFWAEQRQIAENGMKEAQDRMKSGYTQSDVDGLYHQKNLIAVIDLMIGSHPEEKK
jgi:hypothetical protein